MISLLLILPHLVQLCLSHLLIILILRIMKLKLKQLSENLDKGKSILGAPTKIEKKETRNPRTKKVNNKKSQLKKPHLCHHCRASRYTHLNCYKWLATQQSNSMFSFEKQNQFPPSFSPLGDLLKALIFLSNLNGFNSSPSPTDKGFLKGKILPKCGMKNALSDLVTFSYD